MKTFKEFFNEAETKPLSSEELSALNVKDLEKLLDKVSKEASVKDSFIIKLNFTDFEYIMSNKLNIPKKY